MPREDCIGRRELERARRDLGRFVEIQARVAARRLGFGWEPGVSAPSSFDALQEAFEQSWSSGKALPVSSLHCESTIYGAAEVNHALRFWHDTQHVLTSHSFSDQDELQLAQHHLLTLRAAGFATGSLVYQLLRADTIGQTRCRAQVGKFPDNQLKFAITAIEHGIPAAIRREAQLLEQLSTAGAR